MDEEEPAAEHAEQAHRQQRHEPVGRHAEKCRAGDIGKGDAVEEGVDDDLPRLAIMALGEVAHDRIEPAQKHDDGGDAGTKHHDRQRRGVEQRRKSGRDPRGENGREDQRHRHRIDGKHRGD